MTRCCHELKRVRVGLVAWINPFILVNDNMIAHNSMSHNVPFTT